MLEATDEGVSCGVGSGPCRARAGVGGAAMSARLSSERGSTVGVLSFDSEGRLAKLFWTGVGVSGEDVAQLAVRSRLLLGVEGGIGTVSSSGVKIGTTLFQVSPVELSAAPGDGGCMLGVYFSTTSVHFLKMASGM